MFNYINGTVEELAQNLVVLDCGGIGFQINTSTWSLSRLKTGETAKLFTYVHIREDAFELYGFVTRGEKRCFEQLISVSGVGPKAAISILSVTTPENLALSILSEDTKAIMAAPGIGKKIAQRVILELKDKMAKEQETLPVSTLPVSGGEDGAQSNRNDAVAALAVLGYSPSEINSVLKGLDTEKLSTEELIKAALRQMVR